MPTHSRRNSKNSASEMFWWSVDDAGGSHDVRVLALLADVDVALSCIAIRVEAS